MSEEIEDIKTQLIIITQHMESLRQAVHEYMGDLAAEVEKLKVQLSLLEPMTEEYKRNKERATKENQVFFKYS